MVTDTSDHARGGGQRGFRAGKPAALARPCTVHSAAVRPVTARSIGDSSARGDRLAEQAPPLIEAALRGGLLR